MYQMKGLTIKAAITIEQHNSKISIIPKSKIQNFEDGTSVQLTTIFTFFFSTEMVIDVIVHGGQHPCFEIEAFLRMK